MQRCTEEYRLRMGYPMFVVAGGREILLDGQAVTEEDLRSVMGQASGYSAHSVQQQISSGYLTIRGGHRIGLCGEAVMKQGAICAFRRLSSVSVRIARQVDTAGAEVTPKILDENGIVTDTLILAPPGGGKTTLLRDVIRRISDGIAAQPLRVGLADERRELSAMWEGRPQFDIGTHTDVITDCPKADAVQLLVRGMNPQVLAMDEITAEEDLSALTWAAGCGVRLLATAHGEDLDSLRRRPIYQTLLRLKLFRRVIVLRAQGESRTCTVEVIQ